MDPSYLNQFRDHQSHNESVRFRKLIRMDRRKSTKTENWMDGKFRRRDYIVWLGFNWFGLLHVPHDPQAPHASHVSYTTSSIPEQMNGKLAEQKFPFQTALDRRTAPLKNHLISINQTIRIPSKAVRLILLWFHCSNGFIRFACRRIYFREYSDLDYQSFLVSLQETTPRKKTEKSNLVKFHVLRTFGVNWSKCVWSINDVLYSTSTSLASHSVRFYWKHLLCIWDESSVSIENSLPDQTFISERNGKITRICCFCLIFFPSPNAIGLGPIRY